MEQQQGHTVQQPAQASAMQPEVAFPSPAGKRGSRGSSKKVLKWLFGAIGVLLIVGAGGWFLYMNYSGGEAEPTPTPSVGGLSSFRTPEPLGPEPTAAATAEPVAKAKVRIEVLNGTGKAGEAGYLKTKLEALGYEEITAGNADDQDQTRTTVTFSEGVGQEVQDEVTELLEDIYDQVRARKGTLENYEISVVVGVRKGVAAEATPTPAAEEE